jgi:hypothetical protein
MTPPKYNRTLHWPWSQQIHSDDRVHQNPEMFVGVEVVVTEKLDGGNTCLWQGNPYARSTGQVATQGWFAMVKKHHAWKTMGLPENIFTYGEDLYGIHSIEYDPIAEDETYRVFNVREDDEWLSWDELCAHAASLSFCTVPLRFRGVFDSVKEITQFFEAEIKRASALGPQCEGFVIRWADRFHNDEFSDKVAKYVRKGHVQTDEHWTRNWKPARLK